MHFNAQFGSNVATKAESAVLLRTLVFEVAIYDKIARTVPTGVAVVGECCTCRLMVHTSTQQQ
jgi:hypothetical protein